MKKYAKVLLLALIVMLVASITLVACDKTKENDNPPAQSYTVSFGGEGVSIQNQTIESGKTAIAPQNPVREGYDFGGWYVEGDSAHNVFDFSTPITQDIKLIAIWTEQSVLGSKNNPYVIANVDDLLDFADRLNNLEDEEDENFYKAYFRLDADIDMDGEKWVAAGQTVTLLDSEDKEYTVNGFEGYFDGNGHTISNLSISKMLRTGVSYVGFFGVTDRAYIHDLTLENIYYEVESNSNVNTVGAYVGGIVGSANLTNFENVGVIGKIETRVLENNSIYMGGLAGELSIDSGNYILYTEGCHTNITTVIGKYDDGEQSVYESGALGGLFGTIYNNAGAVAVVNCASAGSLEGAMYAGGIVGYVGGSNVSIINCASNARVYARNTQVSYAGGIVGMTYYDTIIMDCYSTGLVRAIKASSGTYKSYAGGIVGFATEDDYDWYLTYGIAVVNSFYSGTIRDYDRLSPYGIKVDKEEITADWAYETLRWEEDEWTFDGLNAIPNPVQANADRTHTVTFVSNDEVYDVDTRVPNETERYPLVGALDALGNDVENGRVFYNWQFRNGTDYRFYMPIVKDITLYARWQDVSAIVGYYSGTGTLHESRDAGIIALYQDGSLQWVSGASYSGNYRYDGEHFLFTVNNGKGDLSGTLKNNQLVFDVDEGISGTVNYVFNKTDLKIFGEYFSNDGDILTFGASGKLSFQSSDVSNGEYINGEYTESGNVFTVSGKYLSNYFSSMSVEIIDDTSVNVVFVGVGGTKSINQVFKKMPAQNYEGRPFVGEWTVSSVNYSTDTLYYDPGKFVLNANGTMQYVGEYSSKEGAYYVFENGKIKVIIEGLVSVFEYDEQHNVLYGVLNRGSSATLKKPIVIPSADKGNVVPYAIDSNNILFVADNGDYYYVSGTYQPNAVISFDTLEKGGRISINGVDYRIVQADNHKKQECYFLKLIGDEEGVYTFNGRTFDLDGIGNVVGGGQYWMIDATTVLIMDSNDQLYGFDYKQAQSSGNVITLKEHDGYQGVWYYDKMIDDDDNSATPQVMKEKYYKVIVSGYGQTFILYWRTYDKTYGYNWGNRNELGTYVVTSTGITATYNQYQIADVVFFYDKQLMYSKQFGYMDEMFFYKEGYDGELALPKFDAEKAGSYTGVNGAGTSVVLNLKADLSGSYRGLPFVGLYDGEDVVNFTVSGTLYSFNINTLVISSRDESIQLTRSGAVIEVIPEAIAGTWNGTWDGYGSAAHEVTIETNGTITFCGLSFENVVYNAETTTITCEALKEGDKWTLKLVWDADSNTISAENAYVYDGETFTRRATLSKVVE